MNFIDISSWQHGIDLPAVFAQNELHGVIVKATEGTGYTNPDLKGWADWLVSNGKPLGLYHYLSGVNASSEAAWFVEASRPYLGKAVLCADYEAEALAKGTRYLKDFLDAVLELTGVHPIVYCSLSVVQSQDFSQIAPTYKLWVAQYASNGVVNGFQEHPWQQGSVSPFPCYIMHQYTGNGRLKGYGSPLDLDLYTGSYSSWMALAKGEDAPAVLKPADPEIVSRVLHGEFGTNSDTPSRSQRLREEGYDPSSVQDMINTLYGVALSCKKYIRGYDDYINSIVFITHNL